MKKKILFIITYLELGGAQKQLFYILQNIDCKKYSLYLYAGNRGHLKEDFLNLSDINIKLDSCLCRSINPFLDLVSFFRMLCFIKRNRFDIIHTHSPKASLLGRWAAYLCGVNNIVYTVHGWPFHKFMPVFTYYFYFFLEKFTAKVTKKIIVPSKEDLKIGLDKRISSSDKLSLIHYGVDVNNFDNIYRQRSNTDKFDLVLSIACLKAQKGISYFLKMAKMLLLEEPTLNFAILGDGPLRKKVEKNIKDLKLENKVKLFGWCTDITPFLCRSSVFVLTSLWEGLPVALIEAVISGVPVVVTDTGGVKDIVENNKQGVVTALANILDVRKGCQKILKDYEGWNRIIKDSRKNLNLKYWSLERMLQQVEDIYDKL